MNIFLYTLVTSFCYKIFLLTRVVGLNFLDSVFHKKFFNQSCFSFFRPCHYYTLALMLIFKKGLNASFRRIIRDTLNYTLRIDILCTETSVLCYLEYS